MHRKVDLKLICARIAAPLGRPAFVGIYSETAEDHFVAVNRAYVVRLNIDRSSYDSDGRGNDGKRIVAYVAVSYRNDRAAQRITSYRRILRRVGRIFQRKVHFTRVGRVFRAGKRSFRYLVAVSNVHTRTVESDSDCLGRYRKVKRPGHVIAVSAERIPEHSHIFACVGRLSVERDVVIAVFALSVPGRFLYVFLLSAAVAALCLDRRRFSERYRSQRRFSAVYRNGYACVKDVYGYRDSIKCVVYRIEVFDGYFHRKDALTAFKDNIRSLASVHLRNVRKRFVVVNARIVDKSDVYRFKVSRYRRNRRIVFVYDCDELFSRADKIELISVYREGDRLFNGVVVGAFCNADGKRIRSRVDRLAVSCVVAAHGQRDFAVRVAFDERVYAVNGLLFMSVVYRSLSVRKIYRKIRATHV